MSAVDDLVFRYHRLVEAEQRVLAPLVDDNGIPTSLYEYDEARTDFALNYSELLHELVAAMYASDNPPQPESLLAAMHRLKSERNQT